MSASMDLLDELVESVESDGDQSFEPPEPVDAKSRCPFTVVVDTREQAPFRFLNIDPWSIVNLSNRALATGDYSIEGGGFDRRIVIERKSIGDLLGSITSGRERFEREFERLSQFEFAAVVIEGQLSEVIEASRKTLIRTDSLLGTLDSWSIRYGVHWRFCMGRRHAEIQTLKLLWHFWKQDRDRQKEQAKQAKNAKTQPA